MRRVKTNLGWRLAPAGLAAALASAGGAAQADQIVLKNGDRLTGKVVSAAGGKILFTPDLAKSATIAFAVDSVATFSTEAPVVLALKDGTLIHQTVRPGEPGGVVVAPLGGARTEPVPLTAIASINPVEPPPVAWHGSLGANGLYSSGASSSLLLGLNGDANRKAPDYVLSMHGAFNYGEQTAGHLTTASANNWSLGAKYEYNLSKKVYDHAALEAAGDPLNALSVRLLPSLGVGYRWFDRPDFHLTGDVGISYVYEDYHTLPTPTERAAASLSYHLDKSWGGERVKVFNDVQILPPLNDGPFLAVTAVGLRTNLTKTLFSEIRADLSYDSRPAPTAKSTSSQLKLGLGWTY